MTDATLYDERTGPLIWPVCDKPDCHTPWILRRGMTYKTVTSDDGQRVDLEALWVWQRDCKHKAAGTVIHNVDGPVT